MFSVHRYSFIMQLCLATLLILAAICHGKSVMLFLTIFPTYFLDTSFAFQIILIYIHDFFVLKD